jgi:hypothetical protein
MRQARWLGLAVLIGACLALMQSAWAGASASASDRTVPALRVLATYAVAGEPSAITDVRWAGDDSVYLERYYDGVDEVKLETGLPRVRQLVPNRMILDSRSYKNFKRLAASEGFLAFSDGGEALTWRSLARGADGTVRFERKPMDLVEDVDMAGDRLLILGALSYRDEPGNPFSPDGAVAFLGSAREGSGQTFRPVLFDPAGKGAPHLGNCITAALGAARFLPDGSFFIVPGFQPGAYLFSRDGVEIRRWNTSLLGLDADADCGSMTWEVRDRTLLNHPEERTRWLARHRVADEVLPLSSGPGVVIRSVAAGAVRWELDVLGAQGIETYEIPIAGATVYHRLRGDVRGGRIVFAVVDDSFRDVSKKAPTQLVVMELPKG